MRFLHTADWHIGKKLHGYDLLENQKAAMEEILAIAKKEAVDAIIIAGDLYDRSVPGIESIELLNKQFIQMNLEAELPILAVSGNHDSATRLATGGPWYKQRNFHLHTTLEEALVPVEFPEVQFFLLPYFEPIAARLYFEDDSLKTIGQAVGRVVEAMASAFDPNKKQVLVSHFFVAGSLRTDSETSVEVGGLDAVPVDVFAAFDYVALGHLHSKNAIKEGKVRYSGSLLKYSLSEINDEKGVWLIDSQTMEPVFQALTPLQDIQHYQASFAELTNPTIYQTLDRQAFWHFEITDRAIIPNMMNQLREIYPFVLTVERTNGHDVVVQTTKKRSKKVAPTVVLANFFNEVTGEELTDQQREWLETGLTMALDTEKKED
ncbi:nuclease SbcCD subunit D [Enterococcus alcedinis]|uniref:Nuclease SbcCD subunit D n=1 Tax=Enterococcus alcedinis TaxID=1274384 RepID=A0A917JGI1_9ENTE|nr:exonuclease SbcCD subunit D [Enterococcus alcedinis]MBP2102778.1 exonuclease SbcD [Enterococcus alcedinis]GGI66339.1 nuclease SbcCD subunit D [Enterococcus alcedinis]